MDLLTFFLAQHAAVHASDASGRVFASERVFAELTDAQMRLRPGPASTLSCGFSGTWPAPRMPP
jgi:hypothetical protein